jgi:hypothetical protein
MDENDSIYVERGNFEQVPDALWEKGAVSPRAVVLYLALSKRGGRKDRGVPKRSTLAKDMGVKSVRTVDDAIDELIEKGWLLITPRLRLGADEGQTSNNYRLLWTPIRAADDPRLVAHQKEAADFNQYMDERQEANKTQGKNKGMVRSVRAAAWKPPAQETARGEGAENCAGPRAEDCTPPVQEIAPPAAQKTAPQETDLLINTPIGNQTSDGSLRSPSAAGEQSTLVAVDTDGARSTRHIGRASRKSKAEDSPHWPTASSIGTVWWDHYQANYGKITRVGSGSPYVALVKNVILPALEAGWTEREVQLALMRPATSDGIPDAVPDKQRFQRALVAVRSGAPALGQPRAVDNAHHVAKTDPDRQARANAF